LPYYGYDEIVQTVKTFYKHDIDGDSGLNR